MVYYTVIEKISEIRKNWKDPFWWQDGFMKRILLPLIFRNNNGIYILEEEWDHMIILDACRYDAFKEVFMEFKIEGKLYHRISRDSFTKGFLIENFSNGKFDDIICITAQPNVHKLQLQNNFYKTVLVEWDKKIGTVPPSAVYRYALDIIQKHPHKKLIIWFLQPHSPYIGLDFKIDESSITFLHKDKSSKVRFNPFRYYYKGFSRYIKINKKILYEAHKENLRWVMPYVKKLIDVLPGKIVVTSDHGDAFGEWIHPLIPIQVYFHPAKVRIPVLVKVPWLIVEGKGKINFDRIEKDRIKQSVKHLKMIGKI